MSGWSRIFVEDEWETNLWAKSSKIFSHDDSAARDEYSPRVVKVTFNEDVIDDLIRENCVLAAEHVWANITLERGADGITIRFTDKTIDMRRFIPNDEIPGPPPEK